MNPIETELIKSIKKGNHKSFELVFKTWYKRLCTFSFGYTRQLETSEDIVKDFFVSFWNNRETIEIKSSLSGYFFHSVRNASINYLVREKKRNNTISIEEINWIELKMQEPISSDYLSKSIMAKELESQIFKAIEKLPEGCCEVFKLSRIEGMSHKDIAKKLNISKNTVKVQVYRALKRLKEATSSGAILLYYFYSKK